MLSIWLAFLATREAAYYNSPRYKANHTRPSYGYIVTVLPELINCVFVLFDISWNVFPDRSMISFIQFNQFQSHCKYLVFYFLFLYFINAAVVHVIISINSRRLAIRNISLFIPFTHQYTGKVDTVETEMTSYVDMSLDDIIQKKKKEKPK